MTPKQKGDRIGVRQNRAIPLRLNPWLDVFGLSKLLKRKEKKRIELA
jgi:hypothetical protein